MRRSILTAGLAVLAAAAPCAQQPPGDPVLGSWRGALQAGGRKLEVALHVTAEGTGYHATFDSITQDVEGLAVSEFSYRNGRVVAVLDAVGGRFEGDLVDGERRKLVGTWTQGGMELELVLVALPAGAPTRTVRDRPQTPRPPFPYRIEEVAFSHDPGRDLDESFRPHAADADSDGSVTLAGTLTLPRDDGPHPAAILITGSGRQDRDETVFGHKPFRVLADDLSRHGFAVLRFDDRGVGASTGDFATATSADFATDVRAALRLLRDRADIDAGCIGLIGHSEGAVIAPRVATGDDAPWIDFVVLLAPPAVPLAEVVRHQSRLVAEASGASATDVEANDRLLAAVFEALSSLEDADARRAALREAAEAAWPRLSEEARGPFAGPEDLMRATARFDTPWARGLLDFDPTSALRALECDVLALFGELDMQVDPAQNLPPLRAALADGGSDPTIVVLDGHNHLFQRAETGLPTEYAEIEETFSPVALRTIRGWLQENVAGGR